ncbi:MAG: 5'/3'-nucleotidase SurE [Acidobacteria bacterium]|nr:5'/3'-nucleotidase SurE [Acidobacteriota bacterium]
MGRARPRGRARAARARRPPRDRTQQGRLRGAPRVKALISNDDGVHSEGLAALERAARAAGFETFVVAPDREQSASSHALTMHRPLRVRQKDERTWIVDGTPTDCVNIALCSILKADPPDFVFSGINAGPNLGDDVTYSGTVACAFEGTLLGVTSIAFSLDYVRDAVGTVDWSGAESAARELIAWAKDHPPAKDTLWNVNIPAGAPKGFRPTRMGRRRYGENIVEKIDPRGKPYYWIGGTFVDTKAEGTDLLAVAEGWVSVTPLHMDMTDYRALADLDGLATKHGPRGETKG